MPFTVENSGYGINIRIVTFLKQRRYFFGCQFLESRPVYVDQFDSGIVRYRIESMFCNARLILRLFQGYDTLASLQNADSQICYGSYIGSQ